MKYEVVSAGYSVGITKWRKDAEVWFKETNRNLSAKLVEIQPSGRKVVLRKREGIGFSIRSISGLQSAT